ncbi:MAG: aldo/keto reductase [Firmicutes bacterium]|nr:aldo/keto reductase [Bacillota bacterium]
MQYRDFGKTGVRVSALGFGAMRLPQDEAEAVRVIRGAFELGVNYIDTAYGYCEGRSEIVVGMALKGWRDRVYVSTKLPTWKVESEADFPRFLEEQRRKLDVSHIDFYHLHGIGKDRYEQTVVPFKLIEQALHAKEKGLIRHLSFSFHDKPEVLMQLVDLGVFSSVLCQYNLLDRANEPAMAYASAEGVGVAVMGPVGGGRLGGPSALLGQSVGRPAKTTAELALRFVLSNPSVACALSGMSTIAMVEENARVASMEQPLSHDESGTINTMLEENRRLADLYCTGCAYCMPCPHGVNIPRNFELMNYHRVWGLTENAREGYRWMGEGETANRCMECGECEPKCPQHIEIIKQLAETAEALA